MRAAKCERAGTSYHGERLIKREINLEGKKSKGKA